MRGKQEVNLNGLEARSYLAEMEKRKILQKPQVGEGILHTAANLMIPLLNQILKR